MDINTTHMKKAKLARLAVATLLATASAQAAEERDTLTLFDAVRFYDGYLLTNNPDSLVQDGIVRHRTSLYAVRLTDEQLSRIGDGMKMDVCVQACCDNYDRIGNVNLALVPKGRATYTPDSVKRIELGRFITPFMDKNKQPDTVPYSYELPYLSHILRDATLREAYDLWVEFELFGVPYAANTQIEGCAERSDVFLGTLKLSSTKPALAATDKDVLVPIVIKNPEYMGHNLNNYDSLATDTLGKTTKTYTFKVPKDVADGQLVLVTSNHGANTGGEEYNRRWHYVYVDGDLALTYKPGRPTCEDFRKYNTQANGIYGRSKKSKHEWQSFSNWCPGDVIDNRIIELGAVKAGTHSVRISVPDAVFKNKQGEIPVSLFFQGLTEGSLASIGQPTMDTPSEVEMKVEKGWLTMECKASVLSIEVRDLNGKLLVSNENASAISVASLPTGVYIVSAELSDGIIETHKMAIRNH